MDKIAIGRRPVIYNRLYDTGVSIYPLCFTEFQKLISLYQTGVDYSEIGEIFFTQNLFGVKDSVRKRQLFNRLTLRLSTLDDELLGIFNRSVRDRKIISLITILWTDRLVYDFFAEVYLEKIKGVDHILYNDDFSLFFTNKSMESKTVREWRELTLTKLITKLRKLVVDSGLGTRDKKQVRLERAVLSPEIENYLKVNSTDVWAILTGTGEIEKGVKSYF